MPNWTQAQKNEHAALLLASNQANSAYGNLVNSLNAAKRHSEPTAALQMEVNSAKVTAERARQALRDWNERNR